MIFISVDLPAPLTPTTPDLGIGEKGERDVVQTCLPPG